MSGVGWQGWSHNAPRNARSGEREVVGCDEDCGAYWDPQAFEEYVAAYKHWKDHSNNAGCSHGH